jgi:hypothetical protein
MKLTRKEKRMQEPCTRAYHKNPMLQEHRLPRARAAAAASRDPLQAQDVPVRRRHLCACIQEIKANQAIRVRAKTLFPFFLLPHE